MLSSVNAVELIVGFVGTKPGDAGVEIVARQLRENKIAGVIFFDRNVENPRQVKKLTTYFKKQNLKVWLMIDEEGGSVSRLRSAKGFKSFLSASEVFKKYSPAQAQEYYLTMAKQLSLLGFNFNLAPVVDVGFYKKNSRNFSANPQKVFEYAKAFIEAHRQHQIKTCLKHYPGHGSTEVDSHYQITDITASWKSKELIPFKKLISENFADAVMPGHLVNKKIDSKYPASLSVKHIASLRKDLGFSGLVISDDMQMAPIRNYFSLEEVSNQAKEAGIDLLIFANVWVYQPELPDQVNLR